MNPTATVTRLLQPRSASLLPQPRQALSRPALPPAGSTQKVPLSRLAVTALQPALNSTLIVRPPPSSTGGLGLAHEPTSAGGRRGLAPCRKQAALLLLLPLLQRMLALQLPPRGPKRAVLQAGVTERAAPPMGLLATAQTAAAALRLASRGNPPPLPLRHMTVPRIWHQAVQQTSHSVLLPSQRSR